MHTYILMSCISSLLMIDYYVMSSPQWCSGVHYAKPPRDRGSSPVDVFCWKTLISISCSYKVKYNLCDAFMLCLDGALLSSGVNTLNSSCSDPRKNVDKGATDVFYWSTWKKHEG
jgi:hypothetical protein